MFLKSIDQLLPSKLLRPLIYWRYIEDDKDKLKHVLNYILINKVLLLKEYINHPDSHHIDKALALLRNICSDSSLSANTLFSDMIEDLKDKSNILSKIDDESIFIRSLIETKILSVDLFSSIHDLKSYTLDAYGPIEGNQTYFVKRNNLLDNIKKIISTSKEGLVIDSSIFDLPSENSTLNYLIEKLLMKKPDFTLLILNSLSIKKNTYQTLMNKLSNRVQFIESSSNSTGALLISSDINSNNPIVILKGQSPLLITGPAAAVIQDSSFSFLKSQAEIFKKFKLDQKSFPSLGESSVRIISRLTIQSINNIFIDLIKHSKENIYIDIDVFVNPNITDALILKKKEDPDIEIHLLVDHNNKLGLNGYPNTIFAKDLLDVGIKVRIRKDLNTDDQTASNLSSFDGKTILTGAEQAVVIHNTEQSIKFEIEFEKVWTNTNKVNIVNIEDFQISYGELLVNKVWSKIINDISSTVLRSKDAIRNNF